MIKDKKILTLGGDLRYVYAAEYFASKGFESRLFGFDGYSSDGIRDMKEQSLAAALSDARFLLLPLPYKKGSELINAPLSSEPIYIDEAFRLIPKETEIFCGRADEAICALGNKVCDYSLREDFAVRNAYLTAEAAIEVAMRELSVSLRETKTAILGYGRIGKALARLLHGFGTNFTVYARREEIFAMLDICSYPYSDIETLCGLSRYDMIINTVPETILGKDALSEVKRSALLIELASEPGGIDAEASSSMGIKTVIARGLPGRHSPVSAGKVIYDTVSAMMK